MGQFSSLAASSRSSPGSSNPGASYNAASSSGAYSRYAGGRSCYRPFYGTALYAGANHSPYDPYADPYSGYLRGSAEVINSQARMMATEQQSVLMAEGVTQARLESRRRTFDQWLYERANRPTLEDERERGQQKGLQRSRNDPPLAEIYSGQALNNLLLELQKLHGRGSRSAPLDLDEDVVRHINLTTGAGGGHVGLLKNDAPLDWPVALRTHLDRDRRDLIGDLLQEAMQSAKSGKQTSAALRELDPRVRRCHENLRDAINDISPSEYIEAKRFLRHLDDALRALGRPDAAEHFNGRYAAQGNSVARLIEHMTKQGLRFAPAVAGDESAYVALHRALVEYESQAESLLLAER